jgi:hypothetical protein
MNGSAQIRCDTLMGSCSFSIQKATVSILTSVTMSAVSQFFSNIFIDASCKEMRGQFLDPATFNLEII